VTRMAMTRKRKFKQTRVLGKFKDRDTRHPHISSERRQWEGKPRLRINRWPRNDPWHHGCVGYAQSPQDRARAAFNRLQRVPEAVASVIRQAAAGAFALVS
jgi:hypothetical protein